MFRKIAISFLLFLLFIPFAGRGNAVNGNFYCVPGGTFLFNRSDTIHAGDTIKDIIPVEVIRELGEEKDVHAPADSSLQKQRKGAADAPVFSSGKDSMIIDVSGKDRMIYYYGDVAVKYQNMELKAEYMEYNTNDGTVYAIGIPDSTGKIIGRPVMTESGKTYAMESIRYNFKSGKAKITNVITQEGEGYLHGAVIKKMPDNSINVSDGKYTTCDLEHPHFYMRMSQAKVTPEPNSQTVFGPSYLVLEDVPTPFALPFGFFPKRTDRSGGILFPTFGEEVSRGFFFKDLGYYIVIGEYFDVAITGDYYTLGSWAVRANSRYKKLYKYNGNFTFNISEVISGEKGSTDYVNSRMFSVQWSHTQDPKARPGTRFGASVNFSSSSYNTYNSYTPQQAMQNTMSSSISYGKTWDNTPFNLSVNLAHSQNMRDSSYAVTIPNLTFTMNRIYPFKRKNRIGKELWYEQFALNYSTTFDNKINFKESEVGTPDFWKKFRNGMQHTFGVALPSFSLLKHIQLSPSVNYGMNWFFQSNEKQYNDSTQKVEDHMSPAFSEFHATQNYSFSVSASTRLYGTFQFGRNSFLRALRHMMTPSVSLSYHPDLGTYGNGYRSYSYVDANGVPKTMDYNIFSGQIYAPPAPGESGSMGFSLANNLEAKVRSKKDTANGGEKKIKLIDNFNISGSYNFLADSMKLSTINMSLNTNLFEKLALNFTAIFDPYMIIPDKNTGRGVRINKFALSNGQGLMRLINAGFSFGYNFQGGSKDTKNIPPQGVPRYNPITGEYVATDWIYYADYNAPWSLGFNYSFNYVADYVYANNVFTKENKYQQSLSFNGQISPTDKLNISVSSGFDFKAMQITSTNIQISYDLHCFEMSFNWVPSGRWESYSFRISAKASALADLLKYDKRTSYWDNY